MKNLTRRNFIGGFVGGVFGILALALVAPMALPFGCIGGVVIGFWWQELKALPSQARHAMTEHVFKKAKTQKAHWVDRGRRWTWIGMNLALIPWVLMMVIVFFGSKENNGFALVWGAMFLGFLFASCCRMMQLDHLGNDESFNTDHDFTVKRVRRFYTLYARAQKWKQFLILREFLITSGCLLLGLTVTPIGLLLIVVVGAGGVLPLATFFFICRGVYEIIMRQSHWPCVVVTILVTAVTAFLFRDVMQDTPTSAFVWFAALSAGSLSGGLSAFALFVLQWLAKRHPNGMYVLGHLDEFGLKLLSWLNRKRTTFFSPEQYQYRHRRI